LRVLPNYRQIGLFFRSNKLLTMLLVLAMLSTAWSGDPGLTFRRSIATLAATLFGVDFALRHSIKDQLRRLCFVLGTVVLLSVVVQVCWPGAIPNLDTTYGNGWNGAFEQKNTFARIVVLTAIAFLTQSGGRRKLLKDGLVICCASAVIAGTQSRTAVMVLFALLFILAGARLLLSARSPRMIWLVGTAIGLPTLYLASTNLEFLTGILGRNTTLTGRTDIWHMALASFLKSPFLGYGYSAFWNVSPEGLKINSVLHWAVPHAHNGFLDLALQLGLVGLCLYLAYYAISLRRAVEYARTHFLYSITESSPLASNSLFWMLYTSVACSLTATPVLHPADPESADLPNTELLPGLQLNRGQI
jgi:exopolysaccharide production protein ExoQ